MAGELRVVTHDPDSETLSSVTEIFLNGAPFEIAHCRKVSGAYLLRIAGIDDRDVAAGYRGSKVSVPRDSVPMKDGEFLLADLVGCRVVLADESEWGEVARVEVGPQDRLIIHDGDIERMLPLVSEMVVSIDLDAGVIVVDPPEGMPESPLER